MQTDAEQCIPTRGISLESFSPAFSKAILAALVAVCAGREGRQPVRSEPWATDAPEAIITAKPAAKPTATDRKKQFMPFTSVPGFQ